MLKRIFGEGESREKPANPCSPGRMNIQLCVCECVCGIYLIMQ